MLTSLSEIMLLLRMAEAITVYDSQNCHKKK